MKQLIPILLLAAALPGSGRSPQRPEATYLGVVDYGANDSIDKADFQFRFLPAGDNVERHYYIPTDHGRYTLQNRLQEGARYAITTSGDTIVDLEMVEEPHLVAVLSDAFYQCPVDNPLQSTTPKGVPGERTLTNLLRTAITPMGTTLYVFGGAWNWQDNGGDANSTHIGVPPTWVKFFEQNDASYQYKNPDPTRSYYPYLGYNEYHYCGADCSGFVGWTIYNTLHDQPGGQSFVMSSRIMAKTLADTYNMGTFSKDKNLKTGDIVSMPGHVYMVVGTCDDGSILIAHSTVNDGRGSGIQLSAVSDDPDCEALSLARRYMARFPQWHVRYDAALKDPAVYLDFASQPTYGHFTWSPSRRPGR
ncbi:MAG: hypothetical protein LIP02_07640, partial [Bacteroidales bacterium]|nr:hypothetical protein [Bacteroidales bacterium]